MVLRSMFREIAHATSIRNRGRHWHPSCSLNVEQRDGNLKHTLQASFSTPMPSNRPLSLPIETVLCIDVVALVASASLEGVFEIGDVEQEGTCYSGVS